MIEQLANLVDDRPIDASFIIECVDVATVAADPASAKIGYVDLAIVTDVDVRVGNASMNDLFVLHPIACAGGMDFERVEETEVGRSLIITHQKMVSITGGQTETRIKYESGRPVG